MKQLYVPTTEQSQPAAARRAAVGLAREAGLDETDIGSVALVVTELATNLVKHATGGALLMRRLGVEGEDGVEILSLDKGPGITDVGRSLGDGYSTTGTPGTGLGTVLRAATVMDVYSQTGKGTAVVARVLRKGAAMESVQSVGVVHQAKEGEMVCGDDWVVRGFADGWVCAVVDGLGHGPVAADAALPVMRAVRTAHGRKSPTELVEAAHDAAKPTRGAAFGVAVRDVDAGVIRFAGIGNVAAVVLEGTQRRHLVSYNGILGHNYSKLAEFSHPWSQHAVLVLHSDGISTHWDLAQYPGLLARDPSLIAGVLFRDFARGRDDVTVVVIKERS